MDTHSSATSSVYPISVNEHTSKSLGIAIACQRSVRSNVYVVSHVATGSFGEKRGISVGDILLSINDVVIQQILHPPSRIASILSEHKTPFIAKFMRPAVLRQDYQIQMPLQLDPRRIFDDHGPPSTDNSVDHDFDSLAISPLTSPKSTLSNISDSNVPVYSPLTQSCTPCLLNMDSCANANDDEISDAFSSSFDADPETHSEHEMISNMKELELLHRFVSHSTDKMTAVTQSVHFDTLKVFPILTLTTISPRNSNYGNSV